MDFATEMQKRQKVEINRLEGVAKYKRAELPVRFFASDGCAKLNATRRAAKYRRNRYTVRARHMRSLVIENIHTVATSGNCVRRIADQGGECNLAVDGRRAKRYQIFLALNR